MLEKRSADIKISAHSKKSNISKYLRALNPKAIKPQDFDPFHEGSGIPNSNSGNAGDNDHAVNATAPVTTAAPAPQKTKNVPILSKMPSSTFILVKIRFWRLLTLNFSVIFFADEFFGCL